VYAKTYTGNVGNFGPNIGDPFVATGNASFVLSAAGGLTYNGATKLVTSMCLEDSPTTGAPLYIEMQPSDHVDFFTDSGFTGSFANGASFDVVRGGSCTTTCGSGGGGTTPTVTGLSTNTGPVGTTVTITGTNLGLGFPPAPIVKFGTTAVTTPLTFNGQTSVSFTVPAGLAVGAHILTIGGMSGTPVTVGTFTVTPPSPWPAPTGIVMRGSVPADNIVELIIQGGGRAISALVYENASYNVYRSTVDGFTIGAGNKINTSLVPNRIYRDTTALASTQYFYKATAVYADGESVASPQFSVMTNAALVNRFTPATQIPGARKNHTATLLSDGKVLVTGGYGPGGWFSGISGGAWNGELDSAVIFNPAANTWAAAGATGKMSAGRSSHTATLLNDGKVLVVGGTATGNGSQTAELYDPITNTWVAAGTLPNGASRHTATKLVDGRVLVAGGRGLGTNSIADVQIYDPATNTWLAATPMINPRSSHTATLLQDGKILVIGGTTDGGATYTSTAELYDPVTSNWSAANSMTTGRMAHSATLLQNGKVLVTHGFPNVVATELYDPTTNTWGVAVNASSARDFGLSSLNGGSSTLLGDGNVLFIGGNQSIFAELYQPTANLYSGASSMTAPRNGHTATLLQDGKVIVIGGYGVDQNTTINANVDLYQ
jgi:N-acetylneuraminic acid mutarotase